MAPQLTNIDWKTIIYAQSAFLITSLLANSWAAETPLKYQQKLSAGIYAHKNNGPVMYESYAAMTFELELPLANTSTLAFDYACPDDKLGSNYSCPVYFHLRKLWDELRPFIELHHLRDAAAAPGDSNSARIPSCIEISRHFLSPGLSAETLRKYKQLLKSCVNGLQATSIVKRQQASTTMTFDSQKLTRSFIENYYTVLPSNKRVDKAILVNMLAVADGLKLTQLIQEAQTWTDALNKCRNSQVPSSRISHSLLRNMLGVLQRKLGDLELVLDPDGDLSQYFTLPLSDCALTNDRLFVRVLVPTKSRGTEWSSYSMTSTPFVYNDGEDGSALVCTVKDGDVIAGKVQSFERRSKASFPVSCSPKTDSLCHNGDTMESLGHFKKTCASELLGGNKQQILKLCDLHCEPLETFRTPIVMRVAPDTFYITGKVEETVQTLCDNSTDTIKPVREGALEVHLPCGCQIMSNGKILTSLEPCGRNLTVYTVKPIHLASSTSSVEDVIDPLVLGGNASREPRTRL